MREESYSLEDVFIVVVEKAQAARQKGGRGVKMRRILAQARKELTQIRRDRLALILALVLPLALILLLSTAISLTVHDLPLIVQDFDDSMASRRFIDAFRASLTFHVVSWPSDRRAEDALLANAARGVLIIPRNFDRRLARGRACEVQTAGGRHRCEHRRSCAGIRKPDCAVL